MNATQPHVELTKQAANLARTAPYQWREFLAALSAFADVHRENLVQSQLADLPVNQGRAQILSALLKHLTNAEKIKKDQ